MSTLRISNIEAKADSSSPTVDEQLRFTNSDGDLMLYLDGRTAGITTVGINTTNQTIKFDANNNVMVTGIITATEFHGSLAVGTSVTYGDNEKAYFGTGLDLELFHNGTNSVINNTEGALLFQNNGSSSMYIGSTGQVYLNNDITFVGASANALWDKSENYFSIPDKIVHSGDTNTAIRFPAADTISMETAGVERLHIDSSGRVAIGLSAYVNTTPSEYDAAANTLIVGTGSGDEGITILSGQSVGNYGSIFFADGTGATNSKRGQLRYEQNNEVMSFYTAGAEKVRITSAGNVGINETVPLGKLHIKNGDSGASTVGSSTDELVLENNTNTGMTILSATNGEGGICFGDSGDHNIGKLVYSHADNSMQFKTNDTEGLRITSGGDVLIGTAAAATNTKLRVEGSGTTLLRVGNSDDGIAGISLANTGSSNWSIKNESAHLRFEVANNEKVRIDSSGRFRVASTTESADGAFDDVIVGNHSGNRGISILSGATSQGALGFGKSGTVADGYVAYNHNSTATDSSMVLKSSGIIKFNAGSVERLRIKSDGKVVIGNTSGSGTGALTIYPNSITGNGRLDIYGGGDENAQSASKNEVMRIGRGDILDQYYHSIWSATGSGGSNSHFLKFYVSNGNAGATNQLEALSMNGDGYVTKPQHPAFKCSIASDNSPNSGYVSENNGFILASSGSRDAFNKGGHFDEATGKFTAPVTGLYFFHFSIMRASTNGSGPIEMRIKRNGGNIWARAYKGSYTSSYQSDSVTTITNLNAGQYVQFHIGGNMSTYFDDSYMLGYLIG